jgi:hypothetical protein
MAEHPIVEPGTVCPPRLWPRENICDTQILTYTYNLRVGNYLVECALRYQVERCTEDYVLGDLAHSMTLFPGEEVFLSTRSRHSVSKFTDDASVSASQVSRSSDRIWMESFKNMSTDFHQGEGGKSSSSSHSEFATKAGAGGGFNLLSLSASGHAHAEGTFDSSSSAEFSRYLEQHLQSSAHAASQSTRDATAISISQVNSHRQTTTETHDELQVSTRRFRNDNLCHTVTHYFYQVAKRQRVTVKLISRTCRALNPHARTAVFMKDHAVSMATNIKPDFDAQPNPELNLQGAALRDFSAANIGGFRTNLSLDQERLSAINLLPLDRFTAEEKARAKAVAEAEAILDKQAANFEFSVVHIIPTEALYVESELGTCMVCEPLLVTKHELELERMKLENLKLRKEIELMEQYKDYRCCDDDEDEDDD